MNENLEQFGAPPGLLSEILNGKAEHDENEGGFLVMVCVAVSEHNPFQFVEVRIENGEKLDDNSFLEITYPAAREHAINKFHEVYGEAPTAVSSYCKRNENAS